MLIESINFLIYGITRGLFSIALTISTLILSEIFLSFIVKLYLSSIIFENLLFGINSALLQSMKLSFDKKPKMLLFTLTRLFNAF
ncbi:MAG: hypothetical protein A2889_06755 [Nitrospinae bacterium RIFCSPLOWO2_01_FULL_39_10]|nr:MAG: hypothetical protein A2889_06755 [Nitrospinae bacterium RIFCSPLOWO2_01_FULL_39_10]